MRKHVFCIHTKIVTKKWGGKTRETIFPETQISANKKCWEKKRLKKVRKHVFYIHTNIMTKNCWIKKCKTIFPETKEIVRAKNI